MSARTKMTEIQVDRVQLIAATMHMHARVRPWNNVRPGYHPAPVMYLCNDIYVHICPAHAWRYARTHARDKILHLDLITLKWELTLGTFRSKQARSLNTSRNVIVQHFRIFSKLVTISSTTHKCCAINPVSSYLLHIRDYLQQDATITAQSHTQLIASTNNNLPRYLPQNAANFLGESRLITITTAPA